MQKLSWFCFHVQRTLLGRSVVILWVGCVGVENEGVFAHSDFVMVLQRMRTFQTGIVHFDFHAGWAHCFDNELFVLGRFVGERTLQDVDLCSRIHAGHLQVHINLRTNFGAKLGKYKFLRALLAAAIRIQEVSHGHGSVQDPPEG